jgi:histidyl-tRNA synthetase
VVVGDRDLEAGVAQLKDLTSGDQVAVPLSDLTTTVEEKLR